MNEYVENIKKIQELEKTNESLVLKNNTCPNHYLFNPSIVLIGVDGSQFDVNLSYNFFVPAQNSCMYLISLEVGCVVEEHRRGDIVTHIRTDKMDLDDKSKFFFCHLDDFIQSNTLYRVKKDLLNAYSAYREINEQTISQDTTGSLFSDFILQMNQQYIKPKLRSELLSQKIHHADEIENKTQELINNFICSLYAKKSVDNQISNTVIQSILDVLEPHEKKYNAAQLEKSLPLKEKSKTHKI